MRRTVPGRQFEAVAATNGSSQKNRSMVGIVEPVKAEFTPRFRSVVSQRTALIYHGCSEVPPERRAVSVSAAVVDRLDQRK
jgi:hypothetical protein